MTSASAIALAPSVKPTAPFAASRPISVRCAAGQPLGRGGVGVDLGEPDLARPAGQELDDRDVVDRRVGVRQRDHRRDPAGRRGLAAALDRFHVLGAGLAQLHAHIDEPGSEAQPLGVARSRHRGPRTARSPPTAAMSVAFDQQIAASVEPAFRVEQSSAAEQGAGSVSRPAAHCRDRGSGSRGRPCGPRPPSRPDGGSGCGRCRRRPRCRSRRRGSSAPDA